MLGYKCPIQELEGIQVQITFCLAPAGLEKGLFAFFRGFHTQLDEGPETP